MMCLKAFLSAPSKYLRRQLTGSRPQGLRGIPVTVTVDTSETRRGDQGPTPMTDTRIAMRAALISVTVEAFDTQHGDQGQGPQPLSSRTI